MQMLCRGESAPAPDPSKVDPTTFLPVLDETLLGALDTGEIDPAAVTAPLATVSATVPARAWSTEADDYPTRPLFLMPDRSELAGKLPVPILPAWPTEWPTDDADDTGDADALVPVSVAETTNPALRADLLADDEPRDEPRTVPGQSASTPTTPNPWFTPRHDRLVDPPTENPTSGRPAVLDKVNRHMSDAHDSVLRQLLNRLREL